MTFRQSWITMATGKKLPKNKPCGSQRNSMAKNKTIVAYGMSSKIKKDLALKKTALRDQEKENTSVHEQLKHSEDDMKHAKQKIASLHKKLKNLQEALDSPSETGRVLRTG